MEKYLPSTCFPAAAAAAVVKETFASGEVESADVPNCGRPADVTYGERAFASDPVNEIRNFFFVLLLNSSIFQLIKPTDLGQLIRFAFFIGKWKRETNKRKVITSEIVK